MTHHTYLCLIIGYTCSGKSSLIKDIVGSNPTNCKHLVSYTTRKRRPGELQGDEYVFVDSQAYSDHKDSSKRWEEIDLGENLYGVNVEEIENLVKNRYNIFQPLLPRRAAVIKKLELYNCPIKLYWMNTPKSTCIIRSLRDRPIKRTLYLLMNERFSLVKEFSPIFIPFSNAKSVLKRDLCL